MTESTSPNRHPFEAAYRGAASIALGGLALLMLWPAIQVRGWVASRGYGSPYGSRGNEELPLVVMVTLFANAAIVAMAVFGIVEGFRGWTVSRKTGEPRVLCHVGVAFGVLAAISWLLIGCGFIWWGERLLR
jgi:hypothetical protein